MKANMVDLRKRSKEITRALERNEEIELLYHGVAKAKIIPIQKPSSQKPVRVLDHPFFGMQKNRSSNPSQEVRDMRKGRYGNL